MVRPLLIASLLYLPSVWFASPYPASDLITDVSYTWSSHKRMASGADNWAITWADDNHQYTVWGDGWGFENAPLKAGLGISRIEGPATSYQCYDVFYGDRQGSGGTWDAKSYGIVCIGGVVYMWVGPGSNTRSYTEARICRSTDHCKNWTRATWAFQKADGIIMPTICNFGQDYAGARDNYVYSYFIGLQGNPSSLNVHKPGKIYLARVPQDKIMTQSAYQFVTGFSSGDPTWGSLANKAPVFQDPDGVGWCMSVSYNPGLKRYILCTEHTASFQSNLGMFEAPEPWGPWKTIKYYSGWGTGSSQPDMDKLFFWNFSTKWLSADGKDFTLVFTGIQGSDSWNTVQGSFTTSTGIRLDKKQGSFFPRKPIPDHLVYNIRGLAFNSPQNSGIYFYKVLITPGRERQTLLYFH